MSIASGLPARRVPLLIGAGDWMTVTVRDAVPADADRIAMLLTQLGYPATGSEVAGRLRYWLDDPFSRVLVADRAGHVVGCLSIHAVPYLEKTGRWARIESLVVDTAARRTGTAALHRPPRGRQGQHHRLTARAGLAGATERRCR